MNKAWTILLFCLPLYCIGQQTTRALPQTERPVSRLDLSLNGIKYVHANYPNLNGDGLTLSLKELRLDSTDIDILGRYLPSSFSTILTSQHANDMATIIGGNGNTFITGLGVATKVKFSSVSFFNLGPEPDAYYIDNNISVQNHSYGLGIENFYGVEARAYDSLVYYNEELIQIFSAGNRGDSTSISGPYAGVEGFANLTGTFKMGKNVLTFGSLDQLGILEARSSRGPAYDGRVKPELVAFGEDGSSGAAAIGSGTTLLLQQLYQEKFGGILPSAGLIRAVLLNSADDIQTPGPDFLTGYGNLNAINAIKTIEEDQFFEGSIEQGDTLTYAIQLPDNVNQLKVTLAWIDPPASIDVATALINDIDLKVQMPNESIALPWVLNPDKEALSAPAQRLADHLNNQEQITLNQPASGTYEIKVVGHNIAQGPQAFAIAYQWDTLGHYLWTYPTQNDILTNGEENIIRWNTNLGETPIDISFREAGANTWQALAENIPAQQAFYVWDIDVPNGAYELRMENEAGLVMSATFRISPNIDIALGLDCEEEFLFEWPAVPGADIYQVYSLQGTLLQPYTTTTDSFAFINKSEAASEIFAVAPVFSNGFEGKRSLALFPEFQRAGCYFQSFLGTLLDIEAELTLNLGSLFGIEEVIIEKWNGTTFIPLTSTPPTDLSLEFRDNNLVSGENLYRAVLVLDNNERVISSTVALFYIPPGEVFIFPNPVPLGDIVAIQTPDFFNRRFVVFDALGRKILDFELLSPFEFFETDTLSIGVYFFQIFDAFGNVEKGGKFSVH